MTKSDILPAWGKILVGKKPLLSVEITKECPLRCPGCYAYEPTHLGDSAPLRQLSDFRGQELVDRLLSLVHKHRPLHLSIVGGEPLVRWRELDLVLPQLEQMGVEVQLVTSAVTVIPRHWAKLSNLHVVVSVDGLQPEHDRRRSPATYERLLQHIAGHTIIVHCTVTRQMLARTDYLADFCRFWSGRAEVRKIWFSLFTPQEGMEPEERLDPGERRRVIHEIAGLRPDFPKLYAPDIVLKGYLHPPRSPEECIFAQTTACVSADFTTFIEPCQIGGRPACAECGCVASAGLAAIGRFRLAGLISVSRIFSLSRRIGEAFQDRSAARATVPEYQQL
jgi:organic radical activating enzyme